MKKSLLNIAVSIAMSGALLSASVISTQAYADDLSSNNQVLSINNNDDEATLKTYMYPGMGVGAATGTVVAGPLGFLIGGLIGAVVGSKQTMTDASQEAEPEIIAEASPQQDAVADGTEPSEINSESARDNTLFTNADDHITVTHGIQLAQAGELKSVMPDTDDIKQENLINILTADLSLDVYFRSGSTDIETFYPARLAAIASLLNTVDDLQVHLDGYTDRRGNKTQNIALAKQRIEKVREQLINAGVEEHRINSKAFGEMKMVSTPGDLEGYTFDRKVVIRFERMKADSIQSMTTALSGLTTEETELSGNDANVSPVVAEASTRF